jgi:hypothetical protein
MSFYCEDIQISEANKLPIGNHKAIYSSAGGTFVQPNSPVFSGPLFIKRFSFEDNFLVCELENGENLADGGYAIWNTHSDELNVYSSKEKLAEACSYFNLAEPNNMQAFGPQYDRYWNGWQFWIG